MPSLSRCSSVASAATCSRVGVSPGHELGRRHRRDLRARTKRERLSRQAVIERRRHARRESVRARSRAAARIGSRPPLASALLRFGFGGRRASSSCERCQNSRIDGGGRCAKSVAHRRLGGAPVGDRIVGVAQAGCRRQRCRVGGSILHVAASSSMLWPLVDHPLGLALRALDGSGRHDAHRRRSRRHKP